MKRQQGLWITAVLVCMMTVLALAGTAAAATGHSVWLGPSDGGGWNNFLQVIMQQDYRLQMNNGNPYWNTLMLPVAASSISSGMSSYMGLPAFGFCPVLDNATWCWCKDRWPLHRWRVRRLCRRRRGKPARISRGNQILSGKKPRNGRMVDNETKCHDSALFMCIDGDQPDSRGGPGGPGHAGFQCDRRTALYGFGRQV